MLYVGTTNVTYSVFPPYIWSNGGEVWSFDGAVWTRDAAAGFGDAQNVGITTMKEYAGALYAGTARVSILLVGASVTWICHRRDGGGGGL